MELTDDGGGARRNGSWWSNPAPNSSAFHFLAPARQFDPDQPELIDRAGTNPAWLRDEFQFMAGANARYGIHQLIIDYVETLLPATSSKPFAILDLGTGAADIPRAIASRFRERGQPVQITAVDRNPEALNAAAKTARELPEIRIESHDLLSLPFKPKSFDLVLCSNALHHFTSADATTLLRRAWELCRVGCVIHDLRRNWASLGLVEVVSRTIVKSPIIRHDAPQSVRAAFTVEELRTLASQAGMKNVTIRRHHGPFRMVLKAIK